MDYDRGKRVFNRLGPSSDNRNYNNNNNNQKVCYHWRNGNCTRANCTFLHHEVAGNGTGASKRPYNNGFATEDHRPSNVRRGGSSYVNGANTWGRGGGRGGNNGISNSTSNRVVVKNDRVCKYWVSGSCSFGDQCKFLHSWCTGSCFAMLTQLEGHQKV